MAGRYAEAHETAARLQRLIPTLHVSNLKLVLGPYRRPEDLARYEEGLRKAGLPNEIPSGMPHWPTRKSVALAHDA